MEGYKTVQVSRYFTKPIISLATGIHWLCSQLGTILYVHSLTSYKPSQTLDLDSQKLSVNTTKSPYKQAYSIQLDKYENDNRKNGIKPQLTILLAKTGTRLVFVVYFFSCTTIFIFCNKFHRECRLFQSCNIRPGTKYRSKKQN